MTDCTDLVATAEHFLQGAALPLSDANLLWKGLKKCHEITMARRVLHKLRTVPDAIAGTELEKADLEILCREEAMLISKDPELDAGSRHDVALALLKKEFTLSNPAFKDKEVLGIAGGICKRRWVDLGNHADLLRAAEYYGRGADDDLGNDGYLQINAAFLEDWLASIGVDSDGRRARAQELRELVVAKVCPADNWWNAAGRAEALFGLGRYDEAAAEIRRFKGSKDPWELQSTATQLAQLASLRKKPASETEDETKNIEEKIQAFFKALVPGAEGAMRSVGIGKVGLALSGGGFRASFYHLGVLAYLAERNVLRHVEVLSCVSGGSIVGACYWLALRKLLKSKAEVTHRDYVDLVRELITHFVDAVSQDLRRSAQRHWLRVAAKFLLGEKGALSPEDAAPALEAGFYRDFYEGDGTIFMHDLEFRPAGHEGAFKPNKHNWLRVHKVPALVINATTVNTGHGWQFTPTWMGEAPWSIYGTADSIPRLQWSHYKKGRWEISLGRAVAASACVPFVFSPLSLGAPYKNYDIDVLLVDGGVHDNQGTVSLLAANCNVILVSDACGQLMLQKTSENNLKQTGAYAKRTMDTLMERVRLANYADLDARRRSGLLRGLMFLHMKDGLDADSVPLSFSQESYSVVRNKKSASGVRKDFQQKLAELRTDLNVFTDDESAALMACGYCMAKHGFANDLQKIKELGDDPINGDWPFQAMIAEITSSASFTDRRPNLLADFDEGKSVRALGRPPGRT